jgi:predicted MFS family arabinose efflux permease
MIHLALRHYRAAYAGLPREVWVLAMVLFVNRVGTMVMPFMALYLTSQLGMSAGLAGRLISVYGLGSICGAYLGGRLAAAYGALRVQTVCMFLSVPGYLVLPQCKTWPSIAVTLFLLSVIAEAVRPANSTAVTQFTTVSNRLRALSLQRLAANLGFSFGPAIGGLLATIDFSLLFVVDALTTFAAACVLLSYFRLQRIDRAAPEDGELTVAASPLRDGVFVGFLFLMLANLIVFCQFGSTYPYYLRDHFGLKPWGIGLMFAVNTTVIVAVEMLLIDAIKHRPYLRTIGVGCFLSCMGWGILPFGDSVPYAVLAMLVVTAGEMLSFGMSTGFAANRGAAGSEAAYLGWYTVAFATGQVLGPAIGSEIYQRSPEAVWYCALAVGVLVLIGFQLLAGAAGEYEAEAAAEVMVPETPLETLLELDPGQPLTSVPESLKLQAHAVPER